MVLIKGTRIQGIISVQQTDSIEWLNIFGFGVVSNDHLNAYALKNKLISYYDYFIHKPSDS